MAEENAADELRVDEVIDLIGRLNLFVAIGMVKPHVGDDKFSKISDAMLEIAAINMLGGAFQSATRIGGTEGALPIGFELLKKIDEFKKKYDEKYRNN